MSKEENVSYIPLLPSYNATLYSNNNNNNNNNNNKNFQVKRNAFDLIETSQIREIFEKIMMMIIMITMMTDAWLLERAFKHKNKHLSA
jgi:hypothetical protein